MLSREELLMRRDDIREQFNEHWDDPAIDNAVGLSLVGAGAATIAYGIFVKRRSIWYYLLAGAFMMAGAALMGGGAVSRRSTRISDTGEMVRAELLALDPIARMQVLRSVGRETMPFVRHSHN